MIVLVGKDLWINGQENDYGVWKYLDGTQIDVTFWIEGEPNGSGKCLRVVPGGGWRDHDCNLAMDISARNFDL
ncbi:hypothetical protein DPMN_052311 [Dreissena polymorpha]|uniref:C-type lectin domain-containing protein n=1 Tax=Dreissena polymorpha TaxID=45954 RepID=A0A9D4HP77_DREPO|nr:hypothetical protein DPMN_052311 [Dreissena polymorpha]